MAFGRASAFWIWLLGNIKLVKNDIVVCKSFWVPDSGVSDSKKLNFKKLIRFASYINQILAFVRNKSFIEHSLKGSTRTKFFFLLKGKRKIKNINEHIYMYGCFNGMG